MKEVEAIVLAGGYGARLEGIARERQKCLLPIEGRPVLGYIMETLVAAFGSVDLKIGIGFRGAQVIDYANRHKPDKVTITYIPHTPGTGGWGIYKDMQSYVKGKFIAMPGDIAALPNAYEEVLLRFEENDVCAAMTLSPDLDVVDTHGVGKVKNGAVIDLKWPPPCIIEPCYLRDMTIWASDKRFFDIIEQYPNPGRSIGYVFMDVIRAGRPVAGNKYDSPYVHLGYPSDLEKLLPKATKLTQQK